MKVYYSTGPPSPFSFLGLSPLFSLSLSKPTHSLLPAPAQPLTAHHLPPQTSHKHARKVFDRMPPQDAAPFHPRVRVALHQNTLPCAARRANTRATPPPHRAGARVAPNPRRAKPDLAPVSLRETQSHVASRHPVPSPFTPSIASPSLRRCVDSNG